MILIKIIAFIVGKIIMKKTTFFGVVEFIEVNIANNNKCGGAADKEMLILKVVKPKNIQQQMKSLKNLMI